MKVSKSFRRVHSVYDFVGTATKENRANGPSKYLTIGSSELHHYATPPGSGARMMQLPAKKCHSERIRVIRDAVAGLASIATGQAKSLILCLQYVGNRFSDRLQSERSPDV